MEESLADYGLSVDHLTREERIRVIALIAETLASDASHETAAPAAPDWHVQLVRERIAAADANPQAMIPWQDLLVELRSRAK